VVDIEANLTVKAIGANYHNAFAIQLNTPANNVTSVQGQSITGNLFKFNQNGTEANQDKAVIVAFDDAFNVFSSSFSGEYINTISNSTYQNPNTVNLKISFDDPISTTSLGGAPFNPFIVINKIRGREVHLAGNTPTSLVDQALFGQGQDSSDPATGKYYMSEKYLPWALNIPTQFDYPAEKEDITKTYLMFNKWALSHGATNTDWYTNKTGYRDNNKIYMK
jgi:LruC domain-containing protein